MIKPAWTMFLIILGVLWCAEGVVLAAAPQNRLPSCYAVSKVGVSPLDIERAVVVLVDQTTVLDAELSQALADSVRSLLQPGTAFTIVRFSAFSQGRYLDIVTGGVLEQPIPAKTRNSISVKALKTFDTCLSGQLRSGNALALAVLNDIEKSATVDLAKSDIVASLAEISRIAKEAKAPRRIVLVVSDMLENSTIASFYEHNAVRHIDPAKEMKTVEATRMIGDFGGASVFVMGAGLLPDLPKRQDKANPGYRDPKTMAALKQFWSDYFAKSNAKLEEFGMPALLSPVQ